MTPCRKAPARALPGAVSGAAFVVALAATAAAAGPPPAEPPSGIHLRDGRLSVQVENESLRDVLDRIAAQTGMKVIYDGPPPRQLVSVRVVDETPVVALGTVLEDRGVPYAMGLDRSRTQVETLVVGQTRDRQAQKAFEQAAVDEAPRPIDVPPSPLPSITDGEDAPENPPDTEYPGDPEPEDSVTP